MYIYMIYLFLNQQIYLFLIDGFPDLPPQLLIQAQLRRLMGSDEQVLVLDVYCALAPKELMACVQLSEWLETQVVWSTRVWTYLCFKHIIVSPQRQARLQHCVSWALVFPSFFVICIGLDCPEGVFRNVMWFRKISSVASTALESQHERVAPPANPSPSPAPPHDSVADLWRSINCVCKCKPTRTLLPHPTGI